MKFTCEKSALVSAISVASRTIAVKSALPVLEGLYVRAGERLYLTGYNLETGITMRVDAEIKEVGACVMPARLFFDIVRKMPSDTVAVEVDEKLNVSIRSGISAFTIKASDAEEFPELPDVENEKGVQIQQNALRSLLSGTIFAVSEDQARPIHTGCLFEVEDDSITVVGVDGYRLARRTYHPKEPIGRTMKFVVPAVALREVEKILGDTDENAVFTLGTKHILFEIGAATLVCRTLEGSFLDWRRVVPTNNPILLTANVAELSDSIERVSLIVSEKLKSPVRCHFGENCADFRTTTAIGTARDSCSLAGDGKELEIGFNCRYFLDALHAVPTEEVVLELSNGLSAIVLTPPDKEKYDYAYMVLPVRLRAGE